MIDNFNNLLTLSPSLNFNQFAHLYQEFANEDRELTKIGMSEYTKSLENNEEKN